MLHLSTIVLTGAGEVSVNSQAVGYVIKKKYIYIIIIVGH